MYYLLSPELCSPVHYLLLGYSCSAHWANRSIDDFARNALYLLSHTGLLDYVINKMSNSHIRQIPKYNNHRSIYPSSTGIFLDAYLRDDFMLNTSDIEVDGTAKISSTPLLFGWDINFRYKKHNFQWYHTDYIYIMASNDANVYVENNVEGMTEEEKYVCFKCADCMSKEDIISQLDELILRHERCSSKAESNDEPSV